MWKLKCFSLEQCINRCLLFLAIKILLTNYLCHNINEEKISVQLLQKKKRKQYKVVDTCIFQTSETRREKSMTFNRFQVFSYFLVRRKQTRVSIYLLSAFLVKVYSLCGFWNTRVTILERLGLSCVITVLCAEKCFKNIRKEK